MTPTIALQTWAAESWARLQTQHKALQAFALPVVTFNNRLKTTAGRCFADERRCDFSTELFDEYSEHFRVDTIPHELIHQVVYDLYCQKESHGRYWKRAMRLYGLSDHPYHYMVNTKHAVRRGGGV
jgi:predicted SprT family Zn-dependent metalloprotease